MPIPSERVVYQCKMHRGIFILPVLSALSVSVPMVAVYLLMNNFMSHIAPTGFRIGFPWPLYLLPGLVVGTMLFVVALVEYLKSEIILTEDRLKFKVGLLSVGSTEMLLSKVETITLFEPLLGRIIGYGTVGVTGTGGTAFRLRFLPNAPHLHSLLKELVNQAQSGRRSHYPASPLPPAPAPAYDETRYMPKG